MCGGGGGGAAAAAGTAGTAGVEAGRASNFWPDEMNDSRLDLVRGAPTRGTLARVAWSMVVTLAKSRRSSLIDALGPPAASTETTALPTFCGVSC
jgi:hypothetical protein